ncbi:MAG: MoaD/ThiS family protein [Sphingobacteriales bacterium]|nr:MoaD/ThiS family protein [Sphingobacteriales bacterium]
MKLLAFGKIAEIIKTSACTLPPLNNTDELQAWLKQNYPNLNDLPYQIAVDTKIVLQNTVLHPNAEIALLPPFSGG